MESKNLHLGPEAGYRQVATSAGLEFLIPSSVGLEHWFLVEMPLTTIKRCWKSKTRFISSRGASTGCLKKGDFQFFTKIEAVTASLNISCGIENMLVFRPF